MFILPWISWEYISFTWLKYALFPSGLSHMCETYFHANPNKLKHCWISVLNGFSLWNISILRPLISIILSLIPPGQHKQSVRDSKMFEIVRSIFLSILIVRGILINVQLIFCQRCHIFYISLKLAQTMVVMVSHVNTLWILQ